MSRFGKRFAFFEEATLTDVDSKVYVFTPSESYPISLGSNDAKDLEFHIDWDRYGRAGSILLFKDLENLGLLNLDMGVKIENLVDRFYGQQILLERDLGQLCDVDLMALSSKSARIDIKDLPLTSRQINASYLRDNFPEFILDFGEALEEHCVQCYVGGAGVLKNMGNDVEYSLKRLCSSYLIIEMLTESVNVLESYDLEGSFKDHLSAFIDNDYSSIIKTFRIESVGLTNKDAFLNAIKSYKGKLPLVIDPHLDGVVEENIFKKNKLKCVFDVYFETHPGIELDCDEFYHKYSNQPNRFTTVRKFNYSFGEISWSCIYDIIYDKIEDNIYAFEFELTPWCGT